MNFAGRAIERVVEKDFRRNFNFLKVNKTEIRKKGTDVFCQKLNFINSKHFSLID